MNVRTANDMALFTQALIEHANLLKMFSDISSKAKRSKLKISIDQEPIYVDWRAVADVLAEAIDIAAVKFESSVIQFLGEPMQEGEKSLAYVIRVANIVNKGLPSLARYMSERGLVLNLSN